jgi:Tol biopolymer transport system component
MGMQNTTKLPKTLERFDVAAFGLIVALIVAIGATVFAGDRAGVGVVDFSPEGRTHSTAPITLAFNEPMNADTVQFEIDPPVVGQTAWIGQQLVFTPQVGYTPDVPYTVTVRAGAESVTGRRLNEDFTLTFTANAPRVVYLAPATQDAAPSNLFVIDPATGEIIQLTDSPYGVDFDYSVSQDGTRIAFAQEEADTTMNIYVVNVESLAVQKITECLDARCLQPYWSPDGSRIVYAREELNSDIAGLQPGVARPWIVNLRDLSTAPMFRESVLLGKYPRWSPDGLQIAMYDRNQAGIVVYNINDGTSVLIPTLEGETGSYAFDPRGERLIYPEFVQMPSRFTASMKLADLSGGRGIIDLNPNNEPIEDYSPSWHPDGSRIALARRYLDGSNNSANPQVYIVDPDTGDVESPLLDDSYDHGAVSWSPQGDALLFQRYPYMDVDAVPSLWIYDLDDDTLVQIVEDAYRPRWLP